MRNDPEHRHLTGSQMSSASVLSSVKRNSLLKECNVDAVLELLHDHNYDTDKTLEAIKSDLNKITSGWSTVEKDIFNEGFRRHQGSLRDISRALNPTKTFKDVADYWFRFKISDQFRIYQDKKRVQAVRLMECIEKRRYHECTLMNGSLREERENRRENKRSWAETNSADVATALMERRQAAKKLLLDVQAILGQEVMGKVASIVKELQSSYDRRAKEELFDLLAKQPELRKRFLDFLPKSS
jgi:hypothetical protein